MDTTAVTVLLMEIPMMQQDKLPVALWRLAFCLALFIVLEQAEGASDLDLELEVGIGHTDNITRIPDTIMIPAIEDTMYYAGLSLLYEQESARSDVDVRAALSYVDYKGGPYEGEMLPGLDASALFRITENSLRWFIQGNVGQQSIDPFVPITPDNRENITYFTTGPSFLIPLGTRFSMNMDAWYSAVNYEEQALDNDRTGARLALIRHISPSRSFSLNFQRERTEFDEELLYPPIERFGAYFQFETEGSRNELLIDLGWNTSERSGVKSEEPLVNLEWQRRMSPTTDFLLTAGTRISDAADNFRGNQSSGSNIGDVQNQQSITDPFRENYARLSIDFSSERTSITAGLDWSDEEYDQQSEFDRQMKGAMLNLSLQLGNSWEFGAFGTFNQFNYDVLVREDEELRYGVNLTWRQLRTLEVVLRLERIDRDSTDEEGVFTENRAYLGFRYIPRLGR